MRPQLLLGIVLAGLGAFVLLRGPTFGSQRSVMRVGDLQASVEERRAVPPWVGGVAVVGGLVMVGAGLRKRRSA